MTWPSSSDTDIMSFIDLCRRVAARLRIRTRYTRMLEEEVARLRAENRALVNSILGVAGIAPMRMASRAKAFAETNQRLFAARDTVKTPDGAGAARPKTSATQASDTHAREERGAALRRRSWKQIERAREIEDAREARRERETDTETFPAPRNIVPRV
jgi:hypothetical protein